MRRYLALFAGLALAASLGAASNAAPAKHPAARPPATAATTVPQRPAHVLVVMFENKAFEHEVGDPHAPYINSLLARSAVLTRSYAVTHPSQPNYLALFSGSTQGVTSDRCLKRMHGVPNLGSELIAAGLSFTGYSEGLPHAGYRGCTAGRYAAKHNPWVHFDNVPDASNQPYEALPADYSQLPTVAFAIPDLCNDMHDCGTAAGDRWAEANLEPYLQWAQRNNSLLLVTYDEDDHSAGNHILTVIAGAGVVPGHYDQRIDHYGVLRTLEDWYGLAPTGYAAQAAPISGIGLGS
ncbi:alkaline phosphatase family protein [Hamadaea tsunoensis]|uniref:alkaline phosphatase family protein n=1 Tax=Hamadaea tsunoensis TaxID=53368 RepID=UPI0005506ABC|nr:alkaline phosphatase family protein [Hamadaea tsunoensis]